MKVLNLNEFYKRLGLNSEKEKRIADSVLSYFLILLSTERVGSKLKIKGFELSKVSEDCFFVKPVPDEITMIQDLLGKLREEGWIS